MKPLRKTFLLCLLAAGAQAAPFPVPTEVNAPFHRDRLPIDTDSMTGLSGQLTMLAQAAPLDSPPSRRAVAQALALAIGLDPTNSSARRAITGIAKGAPPKSEDEERLSNAKSRIWQAYGWLATPEAGRDGNLLADLLGDSASVLDPGHATAATLRDSGEKGNWGGWVAPLASFEKTEKPVPDPVADNGPKDPVPDSKPSLGSDLKASTASIGAVLFEYDEASNKHVLRPSTVRMEATLLGEEEQEGRPFRMRVSCREGSEDQVRQDVTSPIYEALVQLHGGTLPRGRVVITAGSPGSYSFSRNRDDLTGPGFILANSALTGIAPDCTFIGRLDSPDQLGLTDYFWRNLEALAEGPGGRLVVPAAAEEFLMAILALEKPEFLLKYEVLIASTPEEAIALCSKEPNEEHAAAFAKFKEIKDKADSASLGAYLANRFVRQRLVEIAQSAPYHLSAKLLAIQGAGARPRALDRKILAAEIFQAIDPIQKYAEFNIYEFNGGTEKSMESMYDATRTHLDQLDRYTELADRDLVTRAKGLASDLRSLYRAIGGRGDYDQRMAEIGAAYAKLTASNKQLRAELAGITGDPLPEDAEARDRALEKRRMRFKDK